MIAQAQRVRFPSSADPEPPILVAQNYGLAPGQVIVSPGAGGVSAPVLSGPGAGTPGYAPTYSVPGYGTPSYGGPGYGIPAAPTLNTPTYGAPAGGYGPPLYVGPNGQVTSGGVGSAVPSLSPSAGPGAFDPYANTPAAAGPYNPYVASPYSPTPGPGTQPLYPDGSSWFPDGMGGEWGTQFREPIKFLQEVRGQYTWLPDFGGSKQMNVNDLALSATFAVPFFLEQAPFLVTPGFAFHWWGGPETLPPDNADLPPRTYDAFLDVGWQPQITPWLAANVGVRTGVYSDFQSFTTHSLRVIGRGLGVISVTPNVQIAAGVVYLDRVKIKILPAGGIIWSPSSDARYEFIFPNPRFTRKITVWNNVEVWGLLGGEYGGGTWTIERSGGFSDQFDYNDIRVFLGLETYGQRGWKGSLEVGYVFRRELIYRVGTPHDYDLSDSMMLRAGLSY